MNPERLGATLRLAQALIAIGFGASAAAATPADAAGPGARNGVTPPPETGDKPAAPAARKLLRFRLDDGRYQGFHQDDPEKLRTDDRVSVENDRIRAERRALRNEGDSTP